MNRRRFLKGASAATLALPWLDPYLARGAPPPPKRFVIFYVPEGVQQSAFWPTAVRSPTDFDLNRSTEPLASVRAHVNLLKGFCAASGFHNDGVVDMLTGGIGSPAQTFGGTTFAGGVTVDQVLARLLQGPAPFRSYQLGVQGLNKDGTGSISFESKTVRRAPQIDPHKAFADLLGGGPAADGAAARAAKLRLERRRSLLDDVLPELAELRCSVGREAREKLDQHAEAVRSIERQIDAMNAADTPSGALDVKLDPALAAPSAINDNANYPALGKAQMDILVAALAADVTRVASMQWSCTLSGVRHAWLPLTYRTAGWHALSHHTDAKLDANKAMADKAEVYRWYAGQFAYLVERLASVPEGEGTLLDHTLVLYCSEMSEGWFHFSDDIPFVTAGRGDGGFHTGRFFDARSQGRRRYNNDLFAAILRGFGVPCDGFGVRGRGGGNRFSEGNFAPLLTGLAKEAP